MWMLLMGTLLYVKALTYLERSIWTIQYANSVPKIQRRIAKIRGRLVWEDQSTTVILHDRRLHRSTATAGADDRSLF
jgi:hypothetical protein